MFPFTSDGFTGAGVGVVGVGVSLPHAVSLIVMTQPANIASAASSVNSRRVNDVDRESSSIATRSAIDTPPGFGTDSPRVASVMPFRIGRVQGDQHARDDVFRWP